MPAPGAQPEALLAALAGISTSLQALQASVDAAAAAPALHKVSAANVALLRGACCVLQRLSMVSYAFLYCRAQL